MKTAEIFAIRCALADLIGAFQAYKQGDIHAHDWEGHIQSIHDIARVLEDEIGSDEFVQLGFGQGWNVEWEEIDITLNDGIDSINE